MSDYKLGDIDVGEWKRQDEVVACNVLEKAIAFCTSESFKREISNFEDMHVDAFIDISDSKSPEDEEQTLDHMLIFHRFTDTIELLLSDFSTSNSMTTVQLFSNCRDAYEGRYLPLFTEEDENKWFVDLLMSWLEYDTFLKRMVGVCRCVRNNNRYEVVDGGGAGLRK